MARGVQQSTDVTSDATIYVGQQKKFRNVRVGGMVQEKREA